MSVLNCPWCGRLIGLVAGVIEAHKTPDLRGRYPEPCPASGRRIKKETA